MTPTGTRFTRATLAVAAVLLVGGWIVAVREPVPRWEQDLTAWVNDAPAWSARGLWPIMQLGTVLGPVVLAALVFVWRRSAPLAVSVLCSGLAAWWAAKLVKRVVERGRPLEYIADIVVREGSGAGLGFVSGHTAVAFACATALAPELSRSGRVIVFALAAVVGCARVVHGVHLPADVIGGAGLGMACGLTVRLVVERVARVRSVPHA